MNISDEAVEAAYDKFFHLGLSATEIEGILEAAAPYIAAEAWDRCAASIVDEHGNRLIPYENTNPYRSQA